MALFNECMPQCAQKVFDTADIVRDRDLSTVNRLPEGLQETIYEITHVALTLPGCALIMAET
jgi:hypothetical protein